MRVSTTPDNNSFYSLILNVFFSVNFYFIIREIWKKKIDFSDVLMFLYLINNQCLVSTSEKKLSSQFLKKKNSNESCQSIFPLLSVRDIFLT